MKTLRLSKQLAEDQMLEVFDYELPWFIIDLNVSPLLFVEDCNLMFGEMMLKFENKELLDKRYTQN